MHDQTVADFDGAAEEDFRNDLALKLGVPASDILLTLSAGSVAVNSQVANLASEEAAANLVATMSKFESLVDESKFGKCEVQQLPAVKLNEDMEQLRHDHEAAVAKHVEQAAQIKGMETAAEMRLLSHWNQIMREKRSKIPLKETIAEQQVIVEDLRTQLIEASKREANAQATIEALEAEVAQCRTTIQQLEVDVAEQLALTQALTDKVCACLI